MIGVAQIGADTTDEDNRDAIESRDRQGEGIRRLKTSPCSQNMEGTMSYALLTGTFKMSDPFKVSGSRQLICQTLSLCIRGWTGAWAFELISDYCP